MVKPAMNAKSKTDVCEALFTLMGLVVNIVAIIGFNDIVNWVSYVSADKVAKITYETIAEVVIFEALYIAASLIHKDMASRREISDAARSNILSMLYINMLFVFRAISLVSPVPEIGVTIFVLSFYALLSWV